MRLAPFEELLVKLTDFPLQEEPNESDVIRWVIEALKMIDEYGQYVKKTAILEVKDYRASLPLDFNSFDQELNIPLPKHRIQKNSIYFEAKTGKITIHYLAIHLDENRRPLIPDTPEYMDALKWYCAANMCLKGWINSTQELNYEKCQDRWLQKKFEARGDARLGDMNTMQQVGDNYHALRFGTNPTQGLDGEIFRK